MPNHPDNRRTFLDALAGALGGFVREYRAGLGEPPSLKEAAVEPAPSSHLGGANLDVLFAKLDTLVAESNANREALAQTGELVRQLRDEHKQLLHEFQELKKAGKTAEAAQAQASLKRVAKYILLIVGPTSTLAALWQAFIQEEIYRELVSSLRELLIQTETQVGPLDAFAPITPSPVPTPPVPTPPQPGTPTPAEIEAVQSAAPRPDPGPAGIDWVFIPAGPFRMGSDPRVDPDAGKYEQPQHTVHLSAFWISRTPVTNRQFSRFVRATNCTTAAAKANSEHTWYQPRDQGHALTLAEANHPVVQVTWSDAVAFCRWAGVRLPTEAEWEKAARGADGRLYPWGNQPPDARRCNFNQPEDGPTAVDSHPAGASPYGVLDMAGNVYEWCSDWWAEETYRQRADLVAQDPAGPDTGQYHALRGGSCYNQPVHVRCAFRFRHSPDLRNGHVGFRVARSSLR